MIHCYPLLLALSKHSYSKGGFYASLYQAYEENTFGKQKPSANYPQPSFGLVTG